MINFIFGYGFYSESLLNDMTIREITYWNCGISLFDGFSLKRKCVNLILIQDLLFIYIFYYQIVIYFKPIPNGHKKTFYTFLSCCLSSILVKGPSRFLIHELSGIMGFEVIIKCLFEWPLVCKKKKEKKKLTMIYFRHFM